MVGLAEMPSRFSQDGLAANEIVAVGALSANPDLERSTIRP
jgi:hypothetical protein